MSALPQRIYAGELVRHGASEASVELTTCVHDVLVRTIDGRDPRSLHEVLRQQELMAAIGAAKRAVSGSEQVLARAARLVAASGVAAEDIAIDAVRLRAITPDGHTRPEARAAYAVHRDTWYGNSQSQLNWWLPLFDVTGRDSFRIYPDYFARAVPNSSGDFDYTAWRDRVGWQTTGKAAFGEYPAMLEAPEVTGCIDVVAAASSVLVFSAQHLHGTLPNQTERIRYSIDFRTVSRADAERHEGAPSVDNASRGSALVDYRDAASLLGLP